MGIGAYLGYMKIIIESPTEETSERVFDYFKKFCIENLQSFELSIEGTELKFKQEKRRG